MLVQGLINVSNFARCNNCLSFAIFSVLRYSLQRIIISIIYRYVWSLVD